MQVTIVIPTYNEAENLPRLISALFDLPSLNLDVLIVDDNSPDGTGQVSERLAQENPGRVAVLHRKGKLGLGSAYIQGFRCALDKGAQAVGQMDADFSHDPQKLPEMTAALEHCDVALGSRYIPGGSVDERWPLWRKALSGFGNLYARTILGLPVQDVTGGFRIWRRDALQKMPFENVRSNGYAFQVEMTYLAYLSGCSFQEIPIYFADRRWGKSKMSFQIQIEAALRVWQMRLMYHRIEKRN